MGRGRAKAKQTKVARDLKYGGPGMDLDRLRADLESRTSTSVADSSHPDDDPDELDPFADDEDED